MLLQSEEDEAPLHPAMQEEEEVILVKIPFKTYKIKKAKQKMEQLTILIRTIIVQI